MPSNSQNRIRHGLHNAALCHDLHKDGKYPDWVVTTAYYAVVHLLNGLLFPRKDDQYYANFEAYHRVKSGGKHQLRLRLFEREYPSWLAGRVRRLYENCDNARYQSYQVPSVIADYSVETLEQVKDLVRKAIG